eukprot:200980_1
MATDETVKALSSMHATLDNLDLSNEKTKNSVASITSSLESMKRDSKISGINSAVSGVATSIGSNIDKFSSGEPLEIASATLNLVGSVSQFAAFAGPIGEGIAAVAGPVCSLVSGILGFFGDKKKESPEQMLRRVMEDVIDRIGEAIKQAVDEIKTKIDEQFYKELKAEAAGELEIMSTLLSALMEYSKYETLSPQAIDQISDRDWFLDGLKFTGKLFDVINDLKYTKDKRTSQRLAQYLCIYCHIRTLHAFVLVLASTLLESNGVRDVATAFNAALNNQFDLDKSRLEVFGKAPSSDNETGYIYASIHCDLESEQQELIRKYREVSGCQPFEGHLVKLKSNGYYLHATSDAFDGLYLFGLNQVFGYPNGDFGNSIFRLFFGSSYKFKIYGVQHRKFLFSSDTPEADGRRLVYGSEVAINDNSDFTFHDKIHNDRISHFHFNQHLYIDTQGDLGNLWSPVMTNYVRKVYTKSGDPAIWSIEFLSFGNFKEKKRFAPFSKL